MNQSKQITDGALLIAVFVIAMLFAIYLPFVMLFMIFFLPVPFVIYAAKYDWKPTLIMIAATIILSILIVSPFVTIMSIPLTVLAGASGLLIGHAIHQQLSPYETWARGAVGYVAGLFFIFVFTQSLLDINWFVEINMVFEESLQISKELIDQIGLINIGEEEFNIIQEQFAYMTNLIPAGMAMMAIFMGLITQWLSYKVINRLDKKQLAFPPFRHFKLPVALIWIYFIAIIVTLFDMDPNDFIYVAATNVLVLVGLLITLQGFSFIFYYTHMKKWSNAIPVIVIIISVLMPTILLYFVRMIGIIDLGFNLRNRVTK